MTMPHPLSLDDSQLKVVLDRARRNSGALARALAERDRVF